VQSNGKKWSAAPLKALPTLVKASDCKGWKKTSLSVVQWATFASRQGAYACCVQICAHVTSRARCCPAKNILFIAKNNLCFFIVGL
jgi:hypothetical protein